MSFVLWQKEAVFLAGHTCITNNHQATNDENLANNPGDTYYWQQYLLAQLAESQGETLRKK